MSKREGRLVSGRPRAGERPNGQVPAARGPEPATPVNPADDPQPLLPKDEPLPANDQPLPANDQPLPPPPGSGLAPRSERLAAMEERQQSASELRAALEDLRRVLDVGPLPRPPQRRRRGRFLLVLAAVLVVTGLVALGVRVLLPAGAGAPAPTRSAAVAPSAAGSPAASAPGSPAASAAPSAPAVSGAASPTAGLPVSGPGIDEPGVLASAVFASDGAAVDVYEQVRFEAGAGQLELALPSLDGLSEELSSLRPQVTDLQVTLDGQVADLLPTADGWTARSFQGGTVTEGRLRYRLTGVVMRNSPSITGRALAVIGPLSGVQVEALALPVTLRFPDPQVLGATCPTAPNQEMLCGEAGSVWTATVPPSARTPVVLAQVNLAPPG